MMKNDGNGITFCAYSDEATKQWIQYCVLFLTIPRYPIAESPNEMFISKELITQHSNHQRFGAGIRCILLFSKSILATSYRKINKCIYMFVAGFNF